VLAGKAVTAPIWQGIFSRDGKHFGYKYQVTGIHDDFHAASGFISRGGIIHGNLNHRYSLFGAPDALVQSFTTGVQLDGIWQYRRETIGEPFLEKKLHFNNTVKLKGGWVASGSALFESFAFDPVLYADYAIDAGTRLLPFTGTPFLHNRDWVASLDTPQFSSFSASLFYIWGRDENFFEWSSADILFSTYTINWRPTDQIRVNGEYQLQSYLRRTDSSRVGDRRIPRLKVEYQLARPLFVRLVGEYQTSYRDALRDETTTRRPIITYDRCAGNAYQVTVACQQSFFRGDFLFAYQPGPGTVVFVGYGAGYADRRAAAEPFDFPSSFGFRGYGRTDDALFVKASYLFRL
jgi:hypothetical protein